MSHVAMRQLILKDLYLLRWLSAGACVAGLGAAALMTRSAIAINAGGVLLICTLIVLLIMQAMNSVSERKEQVALFLLSLPVSPSEYAAAKAIANLIAFGVPWLLVTAAAVVAVIVSPIPDGYLPFWLALQAYFFLYFGALFAVGLNSDSTGWHAAAITFGNVSVNFFIMALFGLPSVVAYGEGPAAMWTADMIAIVAAAIAGGLAALVLGVVVFSRRTSHP